MSEQHQPPPTTEHFNAFLEAADRVALNLLRTNGIDLNLDDDRAEYWSDTDALMEEFCRPYKTTDIDDVVYFEEVEARVAAVHMVGLALGMRLSGRLGGVR